LKLLVAVLGARRPPYDWLVKTIKRTWASVAVPDVETLFYFGNGARTEVRGWDVLLPVDDGPAHTGEKTLAFFEFALENSDFDVLFRTNCSSYVDLTNLREFAAANIGTTGFYAGFTGQHEGIEFASGSGYFLSRDLVEAVVGSRAGWNHDLLDDVALADVLRRLGIAPVPVPRQTYASVREVSRDDVSFFHFRCKTASRYRHGDVRIMLALHRTFLGARGQLVPLSLRLREALAFLLERALRTAAAGRAAVRSLRS
jgi:Glycosyl transferase family 21